MTWDVVADVLTGVCLVLGALFSLTGVLGLLRFRDLLSRMHAATKPQVLGVLLMLVAVGLQHPSWDTITTLFLIAAFQVLTAPVSAHMIARAGYRTRRVREQEFSRDELAEAIERAGAGARAEDERRPRP